MWQAIDKHGTKRIATEKEQLPTEEDWCNPAFPLKLERLAEQEHDQWMHWTKWLFRNRDDLPVDLIGKWKSNWKPYQELTAEEREKDRKWARKALEVV